MSVVRPTIVFIHGLNTYADGLVHIGPVVAGAMKDKWEHALRLRGFEFVGVRGIGYGPIDEQADRAVECLRTEGLLDGRRPLVLLGHSLGGLVARALVTRPGLREQTKAIFTFGTPHGGAHVTDIGLTLHEKSPVLTKVLKKVGYDVVAKQSNFANFTKANIDEFNSRHPVPKNVRCVSLMCEVKGLQISWPLVPIYAKLRAIDPNPVGDGFILSK
ncbi:MAG: alpha/beta fold hydrolase, partial [Bdellovibrionota bacterium]